MIRRAIVLAATFSIFVALAPGSGAAEPGVKTLRTWKAKCASCHGVDGKGETDQGKKMGLPDMTTAAWQKGVTDDQMRKSISAGVKRPDKPEGMDPYAEVLTPEQIGELATLVRGLAK